MTLLVNLMFSRLDRFDGPRSEGRIYGGGGFRDVNWVKYLVGLYSGEVLIPYIPGRINGILR